MKKELLVGLLLVSSACSACPDSPTVTKNQADLQIVTEDDEEDDNTNVKKKATTEIKQ